MSKKEEKELTTKELAIKYADQVMGDALRGGQSRNKGHEKIRKKELNSALWLDNNFYFSVVFQSQEQKLALLAHIGMTDDEVESCDGKRISVINGIEFANRLGCELQLEKVADYPKNDLELKEYVLDHTYYDD